MFSDSPGLSGRRCLSLVRVTYTWNPTVRRDQHAHHLQPESPTTLPPISFFQFLSLSRPPRETFATFPPSLLWISLLRWPSHVTGYFSASFLPKILTLPPGRQVKPHIPLTLHKIPSLMLPPYKLPTYDAWTIPFFPYILPTVLPTDISPHYWLSQSLDSL